MSETEIKKSPKFTDYISVIFKWKKFIIINIFLVIAASGVFAFLLPLEYKATTTIIIPPESASGFSGLGGLLGNKSSIASIGSRLFGVTSTSEDILLGILNSRSAQTKVINNFNLMHYYEIDDNNMDKTLKVFSGDLSFDANEFGMIEINVINKSPELGAEIANYFAEILDSLNIHINVQAASNNRKFIEKRYFQNVIDLKNA
jgi:uncharacterized protein involved in exopolysaccharide biosynthesis